MYTVTLSSARFIVRLSSFVCSSKLRACGQPDVRGSCSILVCIGMRVVVRGTEPPQHTYIQRVQSASLQRLWIRQRGVVTVVWMTFAGQSRARVEPGGGQPPSKKIVTFFGADRGRRRSHDHNRTSEGSFIHGKKHPLFTPSCLLYTSPSPRDRG